MDLAELERIRHMSGFACKTCIVEARTRSAPRPKPACMQACARTGGPHGARAHDASSSQPSAFATDLGFSLRGHGQRQGPWKTQLEMPCTQNLGKRPKRYCALHEPRGLHACMHACRRIHFASCEERTAQQRRLGRAQPLLPSMPSRTLGSPRVCVQKGCHAQPAQPQEFATPAPSCLHAYMYIGPQTAKAR